MKGIRIPLLIGAATLALVNLPVRAATVDDVIKAGVLRVCTPGDYRPFSFALPDGTGSGNGSPEGGPDPGPGAPLP